MQPLSVSTATLNTSRPRNGALQSASGKLAAERAFDGHGDQRSERQAASEEAVAEQEGGFPARAHALPLVGSPGSHRAQHAAARARREPHLHQVTRFPPRGLNELDVLSLDRIVLLRERSHPPFADAPLRPRRAHAPAHPRRRRPVLRGERLLPKRRSSRSPREPASRRRSSTTTSAPRKRSSRSCSSACSPSGRASAASTSTSRPAARWSMRSPAWCAPRWPTHGATRWCVRSTSSTRWW